jgi:hypothetical protein
MDPDVSKPGGLFQCGAGIDDLPIIRRLSVCTGHTEIGLSDGSWPDPEIGRRP